MLHDVLTGHSFTARAQVVVNATGAWADGLDDRVRLAPSRGSHLVLPAARFGSVDYAGYHSRRDTPDVVDEAQLGRVGEIVWAWLADRP